MLVIYFLREVPDLSNSLIESNDQIRNLRADCDKCFGLCCVALPYAKSADFAFDKDGGTPCRNLQSNYQCSIHSDLRDRGFRGCAVYECFGAGQKVSQSTYGGEDWKESQETAMEMFEVFPIMQQLHEMLYYLYEALTFEEVKPISGNILKCIEKTEQLTNLNPKSLLGVDVHSHRTYVNEYLVKASELVRATLKPRGKQRKGMDYLGAKLKGANLKGSNMRGALLIAADLREADMRVSDFIGADLRDANLCGANLSGSIFLTQAQVNSAIGDKETKLPGSLKKPKHWL